MHAALFYLANILGSAAGSIITGFILMDRFGLVAISTILVFIGILCVTVLIAALPIPRRSQILYVTLAAGMALLGTFTVPIASQNVMETLQWKGAAFAQPFVKVAENRSGIITVTKDGTVYGNGISMASSIPILRMTLMKSSVRTHSAYFIPSRARC